MGVKRVQVVDLFCGGGGFSEGASQAGCLVVLSIDSWHPAVVTHRLNHHKTPCLEFKLGGSIEEAAALIRLFLKPGMHFHLHASPPCQALSNASSANPADGLGLVDWTLALVEYMKPDSWSLENVLPLGKHLKARNVPFEKLNAAHFGVPQLRKRVFAGEGWVAKESHSKEQFVSVLDALPHLNGELKPAPSMATRLANLTVENPMPTVTSQSIHQIRIVSRRRKKGEAPQAYSPTKPAHTITQLPGVIEEFKLESMGANAKRSRDSDLAERIRSLTLEETTTLQGWPGMKIPTTPSIIKKKEAWQIIGNMVCPPVAKAIMEGIQ